MTSFRLLSLSLAGLMVLAACNNPANDVVRAGPQAQHPSTSALAQGTSGTPSPVKASAGDDPRRVEAQPLFAEFCQGYDSFEARERAIHASGRFGPVRIFSTSFSEYRSYPLRGGDRTVVSLARGTGSGIVCSVGVRNGGLTLKADGSVI